MAIIKQDWNGSEIGFTANQTFIGSYVIPEHYVNATEMCRANNKRFGHWHQLESTILYLETLSKDLNCPIDEFSNINHCCERNNALLLRIKTDDEFVYWVHREVAIDLASWINVKFRIWVNRKISELIEYGETSLNSEDDEMLSDMGIMPSGKQGMYRILMHAREKGHRDIASQFEKLLGLGKNQPITRFTPQVDKDAQKIVIDYLENHYTFTDNSKDRVVATDIKDDIQTELNDLNITLKKTEIYDLILKWVQSYNPSVQQLITLQRVNNKTARVIEGVKKD